MRIDRLSIAQVDGLGGAPATAVHLRSLAGVGQGVEDTVRAIISDVRAHGDGAVRKYTARFDTAGKPPKREIRIPEEELDEALKQLDKRLVAGLQIAIRNIAKVADASVHKDIVVRLTQGQRVVVRELPVRRAAVYAPSGRASYPSTVVMGVVAARAAGVVDVAVCTPPGPSGRIDPLIAGVCRLCGIEQVYRMGGAQAIAALAHGTQTIERADVIVGPGNLYVQEAKRQLSGIVGIDGYAGPSDLMIVMGSDLRKRELELVALDVLAQAEHGLGSLVIVVSTSIKLLNTLSALLERMAIDRPTVGNAACALVGAANTRSAIELANAIAPEHLQLIGAEPESLAKTVQSAGCLFVGVGAGTAFGDYVAGSNHVLPTAGSARFASALSPRMFRRQMAEVRVGELDSDTVRKLAAAGSPIARAEGFTVHAESMEARAHPTFQGARGAGQGARGAGGA